MFTHRISQSATLLLLLAFLGSSLFTASPVHGQDLGTPHYKTQAALPSPVGTQDWGEPDELPGLVSTKTMLLTGAITVGAITAAVLLSRRSKKNNKKNKEREAREKNESAASQASVYDDHPFADRTPKSLQDRLSEARQQVPVNVFMGLQPNGPGGGEQAVVMGVSVTF